MGDIKAPDIAAGKVIPIGIQEKIMKEEMEQHYRKQQRRHDWIMAIVSSILGGLFGFLSSLAFWLITTQC